MNKELEALTMLYEDMVLKVPSEFQEHKEMQYDEAYNTIKSALERLEKLEKVWEIVKEKPQQYAFIRKYNITRYLIADLSYCAIENDEEFIKLYNMTVQKYLDEGLDPNDITFSQIIELDFDYFARSYGVKCFVVREKNRNITFIDV